jgi:methyl-accepting chemotaxis protein
MVIDVASKIAVLFEQSIQSGGISEVDLFVTDYHVISNTNPIKHATKFDKFTDKALPATQEAIIEQQRVVISINNLHLKEFTNRAKLTII